MARNLYRFYLYIVYIALLIFVAFAIGYLLNTLLALTPLHTPYDGNVPDSRSVIQAIVFVVVATLIAGALAGLHYWLIRRDIRTDPAAGASAIRSFFLNATEAAGIALGVPVMGFLALNALSNSQSANIVFATAFALSTLALVTILALERRRTQAGPGAAMAFQRLHLYGIQILLLFFLSIGWATTLLRFLDAVFFIHSGLLPACTTNGDYCIGYNPLFLLASLLWFAAFWIWYSWLVRKDTFSLPRLILHCLGLAYGIVFVLNGLFIAFHVLCLFLFHTPLAFADVVWQYAPYDFLSPLTLGLFITGGYYLWLRIAARQGLIERRTLTLTELAIATTLCAALFWVGIGITLYTTLQFWMPVPNTSLPTTNDWATSLAAILAGIAYIPLNIYLRRRSILNPTNGMGPHRGFVLALSGIGILAFAIGGAVALYAWVTTLFGSPIVNWQQVAHGGLASSFVGAILLAIYLSLALREHLFSNPPKQPVPAPVTPQPEPIVGQTTEEPVAVQNKVVTLEDILDDLVAGKITKDEATTHIRALTNS